MQSLAKRCSAIGLALATVTSSSVFAEWQLDMTPGVTDISQQVFDMHRTMQERAGIINMLRAFAEYYPVSD